jgi:hypothetical protein
MSRFAARFMRAGAWLGVLAVAAVSGGAAAQTSIPDFSSNDAAWAGGVGRDFVAVPGSPSPMRQDPAHPFVPNNSGKQPTYRIADLSNPNLKQWARDIMKKDNDEVLAGKIAFTPRQSCMPAGVPAFVLFGGGDIRFAQTPKEVTIIFDGDQQVRHIYMDVPHSKNLKPSWYGESVGHYEGDTLVADTIGLNTKTFIDPYRTPHSGKLHVIERFRTVDNGNQLEVALTIDDPDTYNQPWQAIARYRRVQTPYVEEVCAEGNFLLFDYGIPTANRPDF